MTKYIFVIGGVISGVGKGIATASIGRILKEYGFSVTAVKIDPYINCDAGTLRPTEHGEVWVTHDGGEIDQDLGNYERFLDQSIPKINNITTGQIYRELIERERKGDFLGQTVQFIPHVPNEIKRRIQQASEGYDFALVEIGGTVGDYENIPFLFAAKSLEREIGKDNLIYVLVTYLPVPNHISEMKTKPTQLAIKLLTENAIHPDIILCRGVNRLDEERKRKIQDYSNVKKEDIISMPDISDEGNKNMLYVIPIDLENEGIGQKILTKLKATRKKNPDWSKWKKLVSDFATSKKKVRIGIIGKYLDRGGYVLKDSYISISESLKHSCANLGIGLDIKWINSKSLEDDLDNLHNVFKGLDGIIVPGGFGASGVNGKINAIKHARENNIPFLGLCYGMQLAVVEFARNVCDLDANSSEIDSNSLHKVISLLDEQKKVVNKGGTMRLGSYPAILSGRVREIYGVDIASERHRHRFEVNPDYHQVLQENGLFLSGLSPDGKLVEFIEIPNHKFFIGTQAHPEFQSSLLNPSPLFIGFVTACSMLKTKNILENAFTK